ncbi:hypothetical protein GCM10010520_11370 [Rhizobium viscosum]
MADLDAGLWRGEWQLDKHLTRNPLAAFEPALQSGKPAAGVLYQHRPRSTVPRLPASIPSICDNGRSTVVSAAKHH